MGKGKFLCVSVLSLALLCSCHGNTEETKSEGSKVMEAVNKTVNKKSFVSAAIWDENTRRLDIEIPNTEDSSKVKIEINNRLKNQGVKPYTINIKERDMKIVEKKSWNINLLKAYHKLTSYTGLVLSNGRISFMHIF
ncbi:DUF4030 domain-containing protein [Bacillus sp. BPN334]|nr:DUF4030 domain-containing protein [Bacillus sp. BPN334]KAA0780805.1 DUF4030 domain-containing protein [Bacillus sp. BPN334]